MKRKASWMTKDLQALYRTGGAVSLFLNVAEYSFCLRASTSSGIASLPAITLPHQCVHKCTVSEKSDTLYYSTSESEDRTLADRKSSLKLLENPE